jgi:acyl-CoA thioester hydrolase
MKCKYLKPARYDELISVKVIMHKMPGVKIHFNYELYNEDETLIHTGETLLAFINMSSGRPCLPPQDFLDALKPFFE